MQRLIYLIIFYFSPAGHLKNAQSAIDCFSLTLFDFQRASPRLSSGGGERPGTASCLPAFVVHR